MRLATLRIVSSVGSARLAYAFAPVYASNTSDFVIVSRAMALLPDDGGEIRESDHFMRDRLLLRDFFRLLGGGLARVVRGDGRSHAGGAGWSAEHTAAI